MLAASAMKTGDLVGFTFFIGTMAMFAASVASVQGLIAACKEIEPSLA